MTVPTDLMVGHAGEHLVCADLLAMGFLAYRVDQTAPYDVVVDLGDRMVRLQVKTSARARSFPQVRQGHLTGYSWGVRHLRGGRTEYAEGIVDGFAFAALDIRRVAYVHRPAQVFQLATAGSRRPAPRTFDQYSFRDLLEVLAS